MNQDQARELFTAAYDELLDDDERARFDAALADDDELREEYEEFRALFEDTSHLEDAPEVDLLAGVQTKLRERSGGRFYRDRFSQQAGTNKTLLPLIMAAIMILLLAVAWGGLHFVQVGEGDASTDSR